MSDDYPDSPALAVTKLFNQMAIELAELKERHALLEKSNAANEELAAHALLERDQYKHQLQELLAVIHRDGGQHTESRGIGPSCLDAQERLRQLREPDNCRDCYRYREQLRRAGLL